VADWTPPSWATPEMVAAAEASNARMDEDAEKLVDLARLMAGDDPRLLGQLSRALTKAYFLGVKAERDDYMQRTYGHLNRDPASS
jgi:hypothetical protein